jgi:uncharacterized membrane protein YoaK (UPF0700 family)
VRILVVDDSAKMAGLLKKGLEREGHAVDLAGTAEDAIWLAAENGYDAIVLDVILGVGESLLDGFAVCQKIRAAECQTPVLMVTARDAVQDRPRATSAPVRRADRVNSPSAAIQRQQQNPKEHAMATAVRSSPQTALALPSAQHFPGDPRHGPLPLLLALTAVTGLVDAVSILRLGRVFVANMTGNVVFTGFAITGAPGFSLSASLFALAGFLAGAAMGGMLASRAGHDRALLLLGAAASELILVAAALAVTASDAVLSGSTRDILAALLAVAMGIQSAAARRLAVPDLTTTVLTMTLTGIAADLRARNRGPALLRRLLAVATMLAGAAAGAWLVLRISPAAALGLAAGLLAVVTAGATAATRRTGTWRESAP